MKHIGIKTLTAFLLKSALGQTSILGHEIDKRDFNEVPSIKVVGNKFFYSNNGEQFFMKGIAYQQLRSEGEVYDRTYENAYIDPLAKPDTCLRDLEYFNDLSINLVRVYHIDPEANHDVCMRAYADAGIYVLADLSEPDMSIKRDAPTWDTDLFERYKSVVDSMHKYNNVLGFFAGNEVTNSRENTDASPFVKAAVRDTKAYISAKGYRNIPVGYATNDDAEVRNTVSNYFVCGSNDSATSVDFLGVNMYEWCGFSTYTTSGYRERTLEYRNYPAPVFFSEYGCNIVSPRPFTEVEALYGPTMSRVWSGGIAYLYFEGVNHYGIVKENRDGSITKLGDYDHLKKKLNAANPIGIQSSEVQVANIPRVACMNQDEVWKASSSLPETPDAGKCECLQSTLSCIITPFKRVDENELLKEICSKVDCSDIESDSTMDQYGQFASCGVKQRLSYALNKYYILNDRDPDYCDLNGQAILVTNNDNLELADIYAADGRTCKEAIGGPLDFSSKKEQHSNAVESSISTKGEVFPKVNQREKINNTQRAKSEGTTVKLNDNGFFNFIKLYFGVLSCMILSTY